MANIHFFKLMNWDAVSPGFIAAHKNSFHHILSTRMSRASVGKRLKTPVFMQRLSLNGNNLGFVLTHWMIDEDCTLVLIGILTPFSFLFPLSVTHFVEKPMQCRQSSTPERTAGEEARCAKLENLTRTTTKCQPRYFKGAAVSFLLYLAATLFVFLVGTCARTHHLRAPPIQLEGEGGS